MVTEPCLICRYDFASVESLNLGDWTRVDCPRCGLFELSSMAASCRRQVTIANTPQIKLDALSHSVRSLTRRAKNQGLRITAELLSDLERDARIKNPQEQLDLLVLWLGDVPDPSAWQDDPNPLELLSIVGAQSNMAALHILIGNAFDKAMVDPAVQLTSTGVFKVRLSLSGWERYTSLRNQVTESRLAFMAMKFDEPNVMRAFEVCFKPAAAAAGFTLSISTDIQKAGHIDDQMMVAIRTSKFLVADTSDDNRGVYWEAGFAHGLGKPVFYTCREDIFNDPNQKPHFDIDHMVTIKWNPEKLDAARKELTAKIRNTFPTDSKLSDDI